MVTRWLRRERPRPISVGIASSEWEGSQTDTIKDRPLREPKVRRGKHQDWLELCVYEGRARNT